MILALDPGVSGAVAVLHDDGSLASCWDMPTVSVSVGGKQRNRIAAPVLAQQIGEWRAKATHLHAVLENVGPMPRDGSQQAFGLGYSKGMIEGVLSALAVPYVLVTPAAWKRAAGLTSDKGAARMLAMRTWPAHAGLFARVKDDGRAESCLLGLHVLQARERRAA